MGQKVVLITGGSRGIGAACVRRFAADGCRVVINYRGSRGQAEALAAQVGPCFPTSSTGRRGAS